MTQNKNIILYDFLLVQGGAESLTLTLCNASPDLDLGIGFIDSESFPKSPISPQRIKLFSRFTKLLGWQTLKTAYAFEAKATMVNAYDKVIFSGSNAPLAVKGRKPGGNILYCHTPPRFIYDLKAHYLTSVPLWQSFLLKLLIAYIQPKYEAAITKMDLVIANSINVQTRIKKYLKTDAIVIYPPCHIDKYEWQSQGDYYLSTARVEPYKRIKRIVEAFKKMPDKKLIVASGGSQLAELKQLANKAENIRFTGWCDEQDLIDLVSNSIATIYLPIDEDFGISPVESMAAGKPVIGVNEGGVVETVIDGKTGLLCPENPKLEDVISAVKKMTPEYALKLKANCTQRAQLFSADIFIDKMQQLLNCNNNDLLMVATKVDASKN